MGILLIFIGSAFCEIADSLGKDAVSSNKQTPFMMAFLIEFWSFIFFVLICVFQHSAFVFNFASLSTFTVRAVLEIVQLYITVLAIVKSDRSTYSIIRVITIPLLLIVDLILGYKIGFLSIMGIMIISVSLLVMFYSKKINKRGIFFALFTAINAVVTISLFKYDITHFNSVAAEQLLISLILLSFFFVMVFIELRKNPLKLLKKPTFFIQSFSIGLGGVVTSFAYLFGAAAVMTAVKRGAAIFWSVLSGHMVFKEKGLVLKIAMFMLLLSGLVLLSF